MSSNEKTSFSGVIPCHNHDKWIMHAVDSIVEDPYKKKQIAIVDDGSTDSSWEVICKAISKKIAKSNCIVQGEYRGVSVLAYRFTKAGGPSRARNKGMELLWDYTDVFGFLDSDDMYIPGKIQKSMMLFQNDVYNKVGAVYTDFYTLNSIGESCCQYKEPFSRERLVRECIVNNDSLVSKYALEKCGKYDETMRVCEDYDLWMRISEKFVILHIPEALVQIRVGTHSSTDTVKKEIWQKNYNKVFEKAQARQNGR